MCVSDMKISGCYELLRRQESGGW